MHTFSKPSVENMYNMTVLYLNSGIWFKLSKRAQKSQPYTQDITVYTSCASIRSPVYIP